VKKALKSNAKPASKFEDEDDSDDDDADDDEDVKVMHISPSSMNSQIASCSYSSNSEHHLLLVSTYSFLLNVWSQLFLNCVFFICMHFYWVRVVFMLTYDIFPASKWEGEC
jgi:hypothetical protein